jgi:6-phosphofructokinase 1
VSDSIKKIGIFTSGGDAPGMNAALRAVVRSAIYYNKEILGIMRGYEGMIDGDFVELSARSVEVCAKRKIPRSRRTQKSISDA